MPTAFAAGSHRQLRDISHTSQLFLRVSLMSPNCRTNSFQTGWQFGDGTLVVLLIPAFALAGAAKGCKCRNRTTSRIQARRADALHRADPAFLAAIRAHRQPGGYNCFTGSTLWFAISYAFNEYAPRIRRTSNLLDLVQLSEASSHESFRRMGRQLASGCTSNNKYLVWLVSRNCL